MTFTATSGDNDRIVAQSSPQSSQTYAYDQNGRLTTVQDTYSASCTTRVYAFDADSNRTSLKSYPAGTGGACSTSTTPITTTTSYDQGDRDTNTSYAYDTLGRTTTVPSVDANGIAGYSGTAGNLTIGYDSNAMVASEAQGGTALTFSTDPTQARLSSITSATTTTTNHFADGTDAISWSATSGTLWTRNILGPDTGLVATQNQSGTVVLQLSNLHGDVVATAADSATATGVSSYGEFTEYGIPRIASASPGNYGWLGIEQRESNALGGTVLMGLRLYLPTGRFLSVDSIAGASANAYDYADQDPINNSDTSGKAPGWHSHRDGASTVRYLEESVCDPNGYPVYQFQFLLDGNPGGSMLNQYRNVYYATLHVSFEERVLVDNCNWARNSGSLSAVVTTWAEYYPLSFSFRLFIPESGPSIYRRINSFVP